jgi:hypothetical protein
MSDKGSPPSKSPNAVAGTAMSGEAPLSLSLSLGIEAGKAGFCTYRNGARFNRWMDTRIAPPEEVIERAAYTIAGQAAEAVLDLKDYRWGSSLDEQLETEAILNGLGLRLGLSMDNATALIFLTRVAVSMLLDENRDRVERTAAALIARRKLDQAGLPDLLAGVARPDPSVGQFVLAHVQATIGAENGNVRAMLDAAEREIR